MHKTGGVRSLRLSLNPRLSTFRKWFNNRKSSLVRFGKGQKGIPGEHLQLHVYVFAPPFQISLLEAFQ